MEKTRPALLAGIFCISAATLCFEVTLTRYFSISQNYHFAFLVISMAFLGYGASGTFLALHQRRAGNRESRFLSQATLLFSLAVLLGFLLSNRLPFDVFQLAWDKKQIFLILPYYLFLGLPFFFAGLTISFAITRLASQAHRVYFSDLIGAGTGSLFAAFIFLPHGEKGVFLLISGLGLLACFLFSLERRPVFLAFLLMLILAEGWLFFISPEWLSFRLSPFKPLPQALRFPGAKTLLTRWSATSRVDILDSPAVRFAPGLSLLYGDKLPPQLGLSVDGGELNAVTNFQDTDDPALAFLSFLPSSLPYSLISQPKVLVLEPKGGLDIQAALVFKASRIKAIESDSLVVRLLRDELGSFWGNLDDHKKVNLISAHPRAALQSEKETFDVIVFSLTDVFGASSTGLYGLNENYLFTVDSFGRILDLLSPGGIISLTLYLLPPPRQEAKILATWIEALERKSLDSASRIAAIRTWGTLSLFIKKSPFVNRELTILREFCSGRLFDTVYYPGIAPEEQNIHNQMDRPLYEDLFTVLLSPSSRQKLFSDYLFEIRPATDNRPFLSHFYKMSRAKQTFKALGRNFSLFFQGQYLLTLLAFQACFLAFVLIILPLRSPGGEKTLRRGTKARAFFYFYFLGASYISIEIFLIQKFILFLGHPLYSVSIILLSLLCSSGLGSFFSKKILGKSPIIKTSVCLLLCSGLALTYLFLLPGFFGQFIVLGLGAKIVLSFAVIFPLGFLMGIPFPTGIRLLKAAAENLLPWAWSANAFSTVIHSIGAQWIALSGGYGLVLALAAGTYLAAIPLLHFADHGHEANV